MHVAELCKKIHMPAEVTEQVLSLELDWDALAPVLSDLKTEGHWENGLAAMKQQLGEDPRGLKRLAVSLRCATESWANYQSKGISEDIFLATMGCFSRFVGEHLVSFGVYGFDREWWTVRQLSGKIFRIGELEYELANHDGQNVISLHIPSDTRLKTALLRISYDTAKVFLAENYPAWADCPMLCHSWLLCPALKQVLPEQSNILRFQKSFDITVNNIESDGYRAWVYKCSQLPLEQLQEDTSLQRNLKRYLLAGGSFPDSKGALIENPFC